MLAGSLAVLMNVVLASSSANAWAYGKMNTMVELSRALADQARCPDLAIDFGTLKETTQFYHIDIMNSGFDLTFIWKNIGRQNERNAGLSRDAVCAEGLRFYGPSGNRLKGLLTKK